MNLKESALFVAVWKIKILQEKNQHKLSAASSRMCKIPKGLLNVKVCLTIFTKASGSWAPLLFGLSVWSSVVLHFQPQVVFTRKETLIFYFSISYVKSLLDIKSEFLSLSQGLPLILSHRGLGFLCLGNFSSDWFRLRWSFSRWTLISDFMHVAIASLQCFSTFIWKY